MNVLEKIAAGPTRAAKITALALGAAGGAGLGYLGGRKHQKSRKRKEAVRSMAIGYRAEPIMREMAKIRREREKTAKFKHLKELAGAGALAAGAGATAGYLGGRKHERYKQKRGRQAHFAAGAMLRSAHRKGHKFPKGVALATRHGTVFLSPAKRKGKS